MEAPEKIYLTKNLLGELRDGWDALPSETFLNIEYIRTDAFIDKACKWLKENKDHPLIGCEDICLSGYLTNEFIEDFKNYMKGE